MVAIMQGLKVRMRDGVLLNTDVYLPYEGDSFPMILIRSPYNGCSSVSDYCTNYANKGYGFIQQDCRGTGTSAGVADLWRQEQEDAEDFLKWLNGQPWFNGNLVLNGESYPGHTQWQLARSGSSLLKGFTPHNAPMDLNGTINYHHGAMALSVAYYWGMGMRKTRLGIDCRIYDYVKYMPFREVDVALGLGEWPLWRKWIDNDVRSPWTEKDNIHGDVSKVKAPAYVTAGWFDAFLKDSLKGFSELQRFGATKEARTFTRLCVEPLDHDMRTHEVDYGSGHLHDIIAVRDRFMEGLMKSPFEDPLPNEPKVVLFLMGENRWISSDTWPLKDVENKELYFSDGGSLSVEKPAGADSAPVDYLFDPLNPVTTIGGNSLGSVSPGQREQSKIEERDDVVLFTSDVLEEDLTVVGNLSAILWASSSAVDTDFTVKLCDVYPDGRSYNVADGIIRASFRFGEDRRVPLTPNAPTEFEVDLWATATTFLKGHRLRVQVSSSNFPRFDVNPNTGKAHGTETKPISAKQRIYLDALHPSRIVLPVLAKDKINYL